MTTKISTLLIFNAIFGFFYAKETNSFIFGFTIKNIYKKERERD